MSIFATSGDSTTGGFSEAPNMAPSSSAKKELYTDSGDSSIWGSISGAASSVWDWATSDTGLSTIGGAIGGIMDMYGNEQDEASRYRSMTSGGGGGGSVASGPNAAELQNKRIAAHNKSISLPMATHVRDREITNK